LTFQKRIINYKTVIEPNNWMGHFSGVDDNPIGCFHVDRPISGSGRAAWWYSGAIYRTSNFTFMGVRAYHLSNRSGPPAATDLGYPLNDRRVLTDKRTHLTTPENKRSVAAESPLRSRRRRDLACLRLGTGLRSDRNRPQAYKTLPSMDRWSARAHEPGHQGCHGLLLTLR
jgi:hypothetical protein